MGQRVPTRLQMPERDQSSSLAFLASTANCLTVLAIAVIEKPTLILSLQTLPFFLLRFLPGKLHRAFSTVREFEARVRSRQRDFELAPTVAAAALSPPLLDIARSASCALMESKISRNPSLQPFQWLDRLREHVRVRCEEREGGVGQLVEKHLSIIDAAS